MVYFLFIIGFVILIVGADFLVVGASSIGKKLNLSSIVIGFTIVAFGTSLPELIINIFASVRNNTDLAIANVLGSNIINTLFIIGAAAIIFPISPNKKTINTLIPISLIAALLLGFLAHFEFFGIQKENIIDRGEGIVLLVLLVAYIYYSFRYAKSEKDFKHESLKEYNLFLTILMITIGVAGLYFGGKLVVDGAVVIARLFGISQAMIGITIVAVATSLPELVTSVVAAVKKNSEIAIGNALGSNIFNVFLVLGVSSIIRPLPFHVELNFDVGMMIITNLILFLFIFIGKGRTITRTEGGIFIFIYIAYIFYLFMSN